MLAGAGEFDTKTLMFTFDGKTSDIAVPFAFDLPEIKARETHVIEAHIKIPPNVGYLLRAQFHTSIFLSDPRNPSEPLPCIHQFPYDIRTGFHYMPLEG